MYSQEMHWRLVARWNGMTFDQFLDLEGEEQSRLVAAYETSMQIDAVVAAENERQTRRRTKKRR